MPEEAEFLSSDKLGPLSHKKRILFVDHWDEILEFIRTRGKCPTKGVGYAESNIRPIARRIFQAFEFTWAQDRTSLELSPEQADRFVDALNEDRITSKRGDTYSQGSKRKFVDALRVYFRFRGQKWDPEIAFTDRSNTLGSDPFRARERELLLDAALEYQTPPSYSNLDPEDRDRWKGYLAQELGKPKEEISPSDWEELRRSWKVPALISTTLDAGWRSAMVARLRTEYFHPGNNLVVIPPEVTVKNDLEWEVELSDRSVTMLERWFGQRANKTKYDDSDRVWLNREGNPYRSKTLNDLLDRLVDTSEVEPGCRRLTWHSIRHSVGRYVYDQTRDLGMVAEILRHKTLEAARKYAHPTPEAKHDVVEGLQQR